MPFVEASAWELTVAKATVKAQASFLCSDYPACLVSAGAAALRYAWWRLFDASPTHAVVSCLFRWVACRCLVFLGVLRVGVKSSSYE